MQAAELRDELREADRHEGLERRLLERRVREGGRREGGRREGGRRLAWRAR